MKTLLAQTAALLITTVVNAKIVIDQASETFAWSDPFGAYPSPPGFDVKCESVATFHATQHKIKELKEPLPIGLAPWADSIKYFFGGRPFPGSWNGVDPQGSSRDIIKMEYSNLPDAVKIWIKDQKNKEGDSKWLFGVYEKPKAGEANRGRTGQAAGTPGVLLDPMGQNLVVLFAAGAIYDILPLWVAKKSDCEGYLLDLERYSSTPKDEGVVAWVVERTVPDWESQGRDISFKVKAQVLKAQADEKPM